MTEKDGDSDLEVPLALLSNLMSSVALVERDRVASDERIALASISAEHEREKLLFELEKTRMANEHTRDGWAARFVLGGFLVEIVLVVTAVVLFVKGYGTLAGLLFGSCCGTTATGRTPQVPGALASVLAAQLGAAVGQGGTVRARNSRFASAAKLRV